MMMTAMRWILLALAAVLPAACAEQPDPARPGGGENGPATAAAAERNEAGADNGHAHGHEHPATSLEVTRAVCVLVPVDDSGVTGVVHFTRQGDVVRVRGRVEGLTPGKRGFHVHEWGDLTDVEAGESAGGHFNPEGLPHGRPEDEKRHAGDFGNVEADEEGVAAFEFDDPLIRLEGPQSIIGRSLIVHAEEDRFTQPTGDAGPRVAFGVIGVANPEGR